MSPENLYFRFFSASRVSAEREARRVCRDDRPGKVALLGLLGGELAGVASYELDRRRGDRGGRGGGRRRHAPARCRHVAAGAPGLAGPGPRRAGLHRRGAGGQLRRAAPAQRLGPGAAAQAQQWRGGPVHTDPAPCGPRGGQRLSGRGGRPGPARGCGQPGAAAGAPVGRGGRRGSPSRIGRPDDLAEHPRRRFRWPAVRGQPARLATSTASRASRRSPRCPRRPTWRW